MSIKKTRKVKNKEGTMLDKVGENKEIRALKKLRDSIDGLITLYEKDKDETTEEEIGDALGKFMVAVISIEALK